MGVHMKFEDNQLNQLREAYDAAFHEWARQCASLQSLADSPANAAAIQEAAARVDGAYRTYRDSRNRLARKMLLSGTAADSRILQQEVARLAYQLWERAGRPTGTAEADWYRAQQLLLGPETKAAA
jgi:hypothetical protein